MGNVGWCVCVVETTDGLFVGVNAGSIFVVVDDFDVCVIIGDDDDGVEEVSVWLWDDDELFVSLVVDAILDVVVDCGVEM